MLRLLVVSPSTEEAASRLLHRESRVRAAVERACAALRKERDDRVKEVTVIKVRHADRELYIFVPHVSDVLTATEE